MKRLLIAITAFMLMLCLSGCSSGDLIVTKQPEDIKQMFLDGESFVFFAGTKDCSSCREYRPIVNSIIEKYDVRIYYLPADDYQSDIMKDLIYNYLFKLEWTPTTYVVIDGKAVDMAEETITFEQLEDLLDRYDFIEKR